MKNFKFIVFLTSFYLVRASGPLTKAYVCYAYLPEEVYDLKSIMIGALSNNPNHVYASAYALKQLENRDSKAYFKYNQVAQENPLYLTMQEKIKRQDDNKPVWNCNHIIKGHNLVHCKNEQKTSRIVKKNSALRSQQDVTGDDKINRITDMLAAIELIDNYLKTSAGKKD